MSTRYEQKQLHALHSPADHVNLLHGLQLITLCMYDLATCYVAHCLQLTSLPDDKLSSCGNFCISECSRV